ncbi:phosphatase 2C domain containing protein, putative [Babesia ovis]|uniref:Phosphatase 2C domain containing protein, putative n=1 Tax=Babesia ovis TaxID=5869 RepID=A0A9W5WVG3_BABOV|nr:phosphatase 2C domain containing protein, putative [Babesia ovis]
MTMALIAIWLVIQVTLLHHPIIGFRVLPSPSAALSSTHEYRNRAKNGPYLGSLTHGESLLHTNVQGKLLQALSAKSSTKADKVDHTVVDTCDEVDQQNPVDHNVIEICEEVDQDEQVDHTVIDTCDEFDQDEQVDHTVIDIPDEAEYQCEQPIVQHDTMEQLAEEQPSSKPTDTIDRLATEYKASMYIVFRVFETSRHRSEDELRGILERYLSSNVDSSNYTIYKYEESTGVLPTLFMARFYDVKSFDFMRRRIYLRDPSAAELLETFYFHVSWYSSPNKENFDPTFFGIRNLNSGNPMQGHRRSFSPRRPRPASYYGTSGHRYNTAHTYSRRQIYPPARRPLPMMGPPPGPLPMMGQPLGPPPIGGLPIAVPSPMMPSLGPLPMVAPPAPM